MDERLLVAPWAPGTPLRRGAAKAGSGHRCSGRGIQALDRMLPPLPVVLRRRHARSGPVSGHAERNRVVPNLRHDAPPLYVMQVRCCSERQPGRCRPLWMQSRPSRCRAACPFVDDTADRLESLRRADPPSTPRRRDRQREAAPEERVRRRRTPEATGCANILKEARSVPVRREAEAHVAVELRIRWIASPGTPRAAGPCTGQVGRQPGKVRPDVRRVREQRVGGTGRKGRRDRRRAPYPGCSVAGHTL
jgi:hypothetical protein